MSRAPETAAVRSGIAADPTHGAVAPPLHLSANFSFRSLGEPRRYEYTRSGNPTRDQFACALAELEGGSGCVVTATGMSAVLLVLQQLDPGDLVVAPHDGYGGTWRLLDALAKKGRFEVAYVDQRDSQAMALVLARRPRLVWAESPSNPLLRLVDLAALACDCHAASALLVVDNTFCSPLRQNPIALGADVVVHSTTKYINGHSDVVGGAVIAKDPGLHEQLTWWANALGITGSPFDSWLALRGLRTLAVRMQQHEANAQAVAELLAADPGVQAVHYPGLAEHRDHALRQRQQRGPGGMVSFELGCTAEVRVFLDGLQCFTLAESLGGVESLVAHPATMTHAAMTEPVRARAGIGDGLLRLSVGIEHVDDLLRDLQAGLLRVAALRAAARSVAASDDSGVAVSSC